MVCNPTQLLYARNYLKTIHFERRLSKCLKKTLFFFRIQRILMDKIAKNKWPVTFQVTKQVQKIPLIVMHYQNKSVNYICQFSKSIHDIDYSTFICLFERGKCGMGRKIWVYLEQKDLFRWNKNPFLKFLKGYHLVKNWHKRI